jgi:outer membrane biosynthesis protein TonB
MVKLSEVLGSDQQLEWYEGVAIVRDVVERQLEGSEESPMVPALNQVQLSPDGHVILLGGSVVEEPVRRMGQMLQAILSHSDPPVQLRLVASQATAPSPAYGRLREYSEALMFFERPGRSAILKVLYDRAAVAAAADRSTSGVAPTVDEMAPLPSKKKQPDAVRQIAVKTSRRRKMLAAVTAGAVLLGCGAAVQYARTPVGTSRLKVLTSRTVKASDGLGGAVVTAVSAVTDRVGLGRLVPEGTTSASTAASTPVPPVPAKTEPEKKRLPVTRPQLKPKPVIAFDLDVPEARPGVVPVVSASVIPSSAPAIDKAALLSRRPIDLTVYSPDSRGVSAPVGVKPQLRRPPAELNLEALGRIELVVSSDGSVESVKLLKAPRNVHDSMFLSAAKAWQFQPALKEGLPVRYRKTVWIAPQ